jgi:hypothetical protein
VEEIRNIDQVQQLVEESLWFAQVARLLTYVVNSKKQASKMKIKTICSLLAEDHILIEGDEGCCKIVCGCR